MSTDRLHSDSLQAILFVGGLVGLAVGILARRWEPAMVGGVWVGLAVFIAAIRRMLDER